ncbi:hypothetical protein ACODNH_19880 (plasmid) [Haloarcula sp. NS06]|uniref:hypothetical protein n=1 Tax=Haloarcula sp. NS06 TaxID=3409688 RepID=UPI003DA75FA1
MNVVVGFIIFWANWDVSVQSDFWYFVLIFVLGFGGGLQLGGYPLNRYVDPRKKWIIGRPPYVFKRSIVVVIGFVSILAGLGLFEIHYAAGELKNAEILLRNLVVTAIILFPLGLFGRYQGEERIVCLGPARSGKSSLMGGFYGDCDAQFDENDISEVLYKDAIKKGKFPERTELRHLSDDDSSWDVIQFSYVSGGFLFRTKQTVTTIDYPGEALTGIGGTNETRTEPISTYVENEANTGFLAGWRKDKIWNVTLNSINYDDLSQEEQVKNLATLVWAADTVTFTLPLEDFLQEPLDQRPDLLPSYCTDTLYEISSTPEDQYAFETHNLSTGETTPLEEVTSEFDDITKYLPPDESQLNLPVEPTQWLGSSDPYYVRVAQERAHPNSYLEEYQQIVESLAETLEYDFVWVVTMADLGYADFTEHFRALTELSLEEDENVLKSRHSSTKGRLNVSNRIDIPDSTSRKLFDKVFPEARAPNPSVNRLHYKMFSRWLMNHYLFTNYPDIEEWMEKSFEHYVYPVWFDIDEDGPQDFRTDSSDTLKGSQFLRARFSGQRLEYEYADSTGLLSDVLNHLIPKDTSSDSRSEQGVALLNGVMENTTVDDDE